VLDLILDATRYSSPTGAGVYTDIPLKVTEGIAQDEVLEYYVQILGVKNGAQTAVGFRLDHSPDGMTTATHTAAVFASGVVSAGDLKAGIAGSAMWMDFAHPVLRIGSSGTGDQFVVVKVWQHRKRLMALGNVGSTRHLGLFRIDSSPTAFTTGIALPVLEQGSRRRTVQYWMQVKEASASAQLGIGIQTGPDGQNWHINKSVAPVAVSAGTLLFADSDAAQPLGPFVRPLLYSDNSSGERLLVEVWETSKSI
jgi:hypothetical protein